jgi:hypothetical protein
MIPSGGGGDRAPEIGTLDENESESGGILGEILDDNERRFDGDFEKKKMLDNGTLIGSDRIDDETLSNGICQCC